MSENGHELDFVESRPQSIHQSIKFWAEKNGDAAAILAPGCTPLTYRRLWAQIKDIVAALNGMGIGRNDRVALLVPDGPEMAVAILGVASGAVLTTLNTALGMEELDAAFADLRIQALVVQAGLESPAKKAARARSIRIIDLIPSPEAEAGTFVLSGEPRVLPSRSGFSEPDELGWLTCTSGTTGEPKVAAHTHRHICTRARVWDSALHLSETDRCLILMPLSSGAGRMNGLLATLLAGGSVVCPPAFHQSKFFEWLEHFCPTLYTGSPTIHRAILDQAKANREIIARCPLRLIGGTSSALPRDLVEQLEEVFSAPVIDMYSSTECGPIAVSPLPPGKRKPGSVGMPVVTEVAIMDEAGSFLPAGEVGEVVVRGLTLFKGYENDSESDGQCFVGDWFRMGDLGYLDSEGYLFLTGRIKEIINRGGQKVSPREVNEALLAHPSVVEAEVFAMPHPRLGEEVAAAVVLRKGMAISEQEIRTFVARRIARFKVPRRILMVNEIPKNPAGKVQRHRLAEKFGEKAGLPLKSANEYEPPRTQIEEQLARIWEEVLGIEGVGMRDDFYGLGGDSIQMTLVISRACQTFGIQMPLPRFFKASTVAQMAEVVTKAKSVGGQNASLLEICSGGSRPPLFWLHGVEGVVFWYKDLIRYLSPDQPVYGVMPLDLNLTKLPHLRIEDMVARYVAEIRAFQSEGPYFVAGPSASGVWAFEVARHLDAQGQKVGLVALFDSACPHGLDPGFFSLPGRIWRYGQRAIQLGPKRGSNYLLTVVKNSKLGFLRNRFLGAARSLNVRLRVPQPLLTRNRVAELCQWALHHYSPKPYPGRLVLFLGERHNSSVPSESPERDGRVEWSELAAGGVKIYRIPCTHREILAEPYVQVVAKHLNRHIEEALRITSSESLGTRRLEIEPTRSAQTGALVPYGNPRLLDMRDCTRQDWMKINKRIRRQQYRLQPQWFMPLFLLKCVRRDLGYDSQPRLWEYPWAVLSANLERRMRVLDVGSGGSAFPLLLSAYDCEVHSADPSLNNGRGMKILGWRKHMMRSLGITSIWGLPLVARRNHLPITYVDDPIQRLRYRDSYFDIVFCLSVIEHISVRDWAPCMAEMSRVLSRGGRLVLTLTMMNHQANARWYEKLFVEPSLRLLGDVVYTTPISQEEARTRHPGQAFETLGLVWEKVKNSHNR